MGQNVRWKQGEKCLFWLEVSERFQSVITEGIDRKCKHTWQESGREGEFCVSIFLSSLRRFHGHWVQFTPLTPSETPSPIGLTFPFWILYHGRSAPSVVMGVWDRSMFMWWQTGEGVLDWKLVSVAFKGILPVTCFCQPHLLKAPGLQNGSTNWEPSVQNTSLWG